MKLKRPSRKFIIALLAIIVVLAIAEICYGLAERHNTKPISIETISQLQDYARKNGMRDDVAVMVDFSVSSKYNRFYVVNLSERRVMFKSKCAHGKGGDSTAESPVFSNQPGSNCSSLGHYKIYDANRMHSWKGVPCLRLKGLDPSNSNAESRGIVIHGGIDIWQYGLRYWQIPLGKISEGCFAINFPDFFRLRSIFKESDKPMLLYAYTSKHQS